MSTPGTVDEPTSDQPPAPPRHGIVDVDVHPYPRSADDIRQYMERPWRDRFKDDRRGPFFRNPVHGNRLDSTPPDGGTAGSDPDFLRSQLMDEFGIAYAILIPRTFCNMHPDPDYGSAIASAYNHWLADGGRARGFKGSITPPRPAASG